MGTVGRRRRLWFALTALLLAASVVFTAVLAWQRPFFIAALYWRVHWEDWREQPELARREWQHDRRLGRWLLPGLDTAMGDFSVAAEQASMRRARRALADWRRFDCDGYPLDAADHCRLFGRYLEGRLHSWRWRLHEEPLQPQFGWHRQWPTAVLGPPWRDRQDAEMALQRLAAVARLLQQQLQQLELRRAAGHVPPRALVRAMLQDLRSFVATAPAAHPWLQDWAARWRSLNPSDAAEPWRAEVVDQLQHAIYPGWQRLIEHYQQQVEGDNFGAWAKPQGAAWYRHRLRWIGDTDATPDALIAQGRRQVAELQQALQQRLDQAGVAPGSLAERLHRLAQRPGQLWSDSRSGRAALLDAAAAQLRADRRRFSGFFAPATASTPRLQALPSSRQEHAPLALYLAQPERGWLLLNLRDLSDLPAYSLPALLWHEGIPGHHLQSTVASALQLPWYRRAQAFPAYSEGWAMHAEAWAGGDEPALEVHIGLLQSQLFRAARRVVDPGLHHLRWSPADAVGYLRREVGLGERDAVAEVDRYLIQPGQAVAYAVGFAALQELTRDQRPGPELDRMRRAILQAGPMPLAQLQQRLRRRLETSE